MSKKAVPLGEAQRIAEKIKSEIGGYCERISIAGSIRRQEPSVGDIEIVCQPPIRQLKDLWGRKYPDETASVRVLSNHLAGPMCLRKVKGGDRFQQWIIPYPVSGLIGNELTLDLFIVLPPANWGVIHLIRTGPHHFSRKMVTAKTHGGYLPRGHRVENGQIINGYDGEPVGVIDTEEDYFQFCGLEYIPPEKRAAAVMSSVLDKGE